MEKGKREREGRGEGKEKQEQGRGGGRKGEGNEEKCNKITLDYPTTPTYLCEQPQLEYQ